MNELNQKPAPLIDISPSIIFKAAIVLLALWFLFIIRDVIALLLIAIIVTAALNPVIERVQFGRLPRGAAVAIVYIIFFSLVALLVSFIAPTLASELEGLGKEIPKNIQELSNSIAGTLGLQQSDFTLSSKEISEYLSGSIGNFFSTTRSVFSGIISLVAVISMSFYMSLRKNGMKDFLVHLSPKQHQKYLDSLVDRIQDSFGRWMAGQVVTMIFVGTLYFIALTALDVPYALLLAVIGGVLEIIPYLGPVMAAVPAVILGFSISPVIGSLVLLSYWVINLIENHVLIPQIMNKAVGLNPVAVILSLLIGAKVAGLVGVILAVPIAAAIGVFVKDVLEKKVT